MQTLLLILACLVALAALAPQAWVNLRHAVLCVRLWAIGNLSGIGGALDKRGPLWLAVGVLVGVVLTVGVQRLPVRIDWPSMPNITLPSLPTTTVDRVAIFHESEDGQLPPYVIGTQGAVGRLRESGLTVWAGDIDVKDGMGDVPEWAKEAITPAREILASNKVALVTFSGGKVLKTIPCPTNPDAIVEAAK